MERHGFFHLGRPEGGALVYAGKAGTARTPGVAAPENTPVGKPLKRPDPIWVEPKVTDIAFTELSEDGMLRHARSSSRIRSPTISGFVRQKDADSGILAEAR